MATLSQMTTLSPQASSTQPVRSSSDSPGSTGIVFGVLGTLIGVASLAVAAYTLRLAYKSYKWKRSASIESIAYVKHVADRRRLRITYMGDSDVSIGESADIELPPPALRDDNTIERCLTSEQVHSAPSPENP